MVVEWSEPSCPAWLRKFLGSDFERSVVATDMTSNHVTDADVENLQGLYQLQSLSLKLTSITDAGLAHLKGLKQLRQLWLNDTQIPTLGWRISRI